MGCRSVEKGQKAIAELESRKPNQPGTLELLHIDVSDENSIKAAAKTVEETHGRSVFFFPVATERAELIELDSMPL